MQIQPYFPEPIEVSRNAASERYMVTLSFVRAVMAGHFVSALAVAGTALLFEPVVAVQTLAVVFFCCLLALTLVRRFADGGALDNFLSLVLLLPTVWSLGGIARTAMDAGLPLWMAGVPYLVASAYGALCGRDLSFVGQFVITSMATLAVWIGAGAAGFVEWGEGAFWAAVGLGYVLYFVYDLAALLSRRRLGEEPAAVADLYRDLLNFLTYSVRVALHWRRFRFI